MRPAALRPCFSSACPYASSVACRARIKPSTSLQEATPAALRRTMESKSDERLADSESIILSCVVRPLPCCRTSRGRNCSRKQVPVKRHRGEPGHTRDTHGAW